MFGIKKQVFYWTLYDLANSLIIGNLTLYFSQWLIIDNGFADIWYGSAIAISTLLLIITAPILGTRSDKNGKKIGYLIPLSIVMATGTLLLGINGLSGIPTLPKIVIALMLFVVLQYTYQLSLVFYDTLLANLAPPKDYGKISGLGEGMGSLGHVIGLFITYPFVNGTITLFGIPGRIQAFIPAAIGFILLALPMLLTLKDKPVKNDAVRSSSYRDIIGSFKDLLKNKNILWFLVAFYFISDVILTISTFFPIYFEEVLNFSDFQKISATILILVFIMLGSVTLGKISDKMGFKKMTSLTTLILLSLFFIFPLIKNQMAVWVLLPIAGFFWGGFYSAARALLTKLSPEGKRAEFFSLYAIFRRSASIFGPLIWSFTVLIFSDLGPDKYRVSIYPLIVVMFIGFIFLSKVDADGSKN
jgi:UMF1 family MFS transporter